MKIADLEAKVELLPLIERDHSFRRVDYHGYCHLNPCPVCGGNDHFTVYPKENSFYSFNECCGGGGVYKYLKEVQGMTDPQAYEELCRLAGEPMKESRGLDWNDEIGVEAAQRDFAPETEEASSQPGQVEEAPKNLTNWINELYQNQSIEDKRYFLNRGIHPQLIEKYKLSIHNDTDGRRAMLPVFWKGEVIYYVQRALDGQSIKYKNPKGRSPQFLNMEYLEEKQNGPIFITEGIVDALSLESMGYKAIAINSSQNALKAFQNITDMNEKHNNIIMTAFDNDESGEKAAEQMAFKRLKVPAGFNDVNEWRLADLEARKEDNPFYIGMKDEIEEQLGKAAKPDSVADYIETSFFHDIEAMKPYKDRKTGFANLDKQLNGLFPGLYVVGGISSVGKTTFSHQLGDQLAENGEHFIFFSLEQSKMEMVSKSLARTTAKLDLNRAVSSISIRSGFKNDEVVESIKEYQNYSPNVSIVEGNFGTDVRTIRRYVEDYIKFNKVNPVVMVDYLQIMPALDERMSDKQRIDTNVTELKRMSRDLKLSVFVISSLNRGNYLAPIDFESFKESGGIEYTADVVMGLQLEVINDELFNKKDKVKEKREKIKEAKVADPRQIELACLKNRNGRPSFSCSFSYWAKYDFYEPNVDSEAEKDFALHVRKNEGVIERI